MEIWHRSPEQCQCHWKTARDKFIDFLCVCLLCMGLFQSLLPPEYTGELKIFKENNSPGQSKQREEKSAQLYFIEAP